MYLRGKYNFTMQEYAIAEYINFSMFYWIIASIYAITILSVIVVILSENRNPVKSLAWVTILLLLPAVGLILYVFFGRNIKNTHRISRRNRRRLKRLSRTTTFNLTDTSFESLSPESVQLIKLTNTLKGSRYFSNNSIKIYTNGTTKFDDFKLDILNAKKHINIQYYIFEDDTLGTEIKNLLIKKAHEGVNIRIIYDHVGSFKTKKKFFNEMANAGIKAHPFFKVSFPPFATRINWRNHRKICIIDGTIGYMGGMNIADRYINGGKFDYWRDTHIRITGPIITSLQYSFNIDWNVMGQEILNETIDETLSTTPSTNIGMQLLTSGPTSQWSSIALVFLKAISNAKRSILIQTPYFLPTESLLKALQAAALAGVKVRIMIPRKSDSNILRYASFSYFEECLKSGIKFHLYEKGMLHSKTIIIDNELSSIGSTNFDFRSFEHNFESNIFIYSREVNSQMKKIFDEDLTHCTTIDIKNWKKRPFIQKALESVTRLLSPIL